MVATCFIIGVLSAVEVYAAQLVWPAAEPYPDPDTAYLAVARRAGGELLFQTLSWTLIVATIGSASGALLAGARLLYGMGRDNAIPKSFFGYLHPKTRVPSRNVIFMGALALAGAFAISYQTGAELLNFGALIGFMGVNISSLVHYYVRGRDRHWSHLVAPAARLCGLPLPVAEPQLDREDRRLRLARFRRGIRRLEDRRVPARHHPLRNPRGRVAHRVAP